MKKPTRQQRKALKKEKRAGYNAGYAEGYQKGLHDGNPFVILAESISNVVDSLADTLTNPKFVEMCIEAKRLEDEAKANGELLEIEGDPEI